MSLADKAVTTVAIGLVLVGFLASLSISFDELRRQHRRRRFRRQFPGLAHRLNGQVPR